MTSTLELGLMAALDGHAVRYEQRTPRESCVEVRAEAVAEVATRLTRFEGVSLINLVGVDERPLGGAFRIILSFSLPDDQCISVTARLSADDPRYPSVSIDVHAADWYERENFDLLGIVPHGHPLPSSLVLHHDWPAGVYPLRKDFPQEASWPERVRVAEPPPRATGPGLFQYTIGPVHYGVTESARFIISSLGEEIADVATQLFWKHRGIEKLCEHRRLEEVALFAERVAANSAIAHSLAFAQAIESATGVDVPWRAQVTRVVLAEMERLYNHVNDLANQAEATGLAVGHAQGAILVEQLRRLNADVSGHRYLFGSIVPGGVKIDLSDQLRRGIHGHMAGLERSFRSYTDALMTSTSHLDRLEETGIVTTGVARDHALVGPVARGSGLDKDARRDHPYAAYAGMTFEVPVLEHGDALARNRIRIGEAFQSMKLIEQALEMLGPGDLRVPVPRLAPFAEAQGYVEGPRGAIAHWIKADDNGMLYRYKIRPASFVNWHVFHLAAAGANILTDFPIIDRSFALVLASNDR